jgi:hypothetical protein
MISERFEIRDDVQREVCQEMLYPDQSGDLSAHMHLKGVLRAFRSFWGIKRGFRPLFY